MILGNKILTISFVIFFCFNLKSLAEDKIILTPLINLEKIKPSFEDIEENSDEKLKEEISINQKSNEIKKKSLSAKLIGLDKITAKTTEININLGETKKFGPLEIKVLKCGKIKSNNSSNNVAYLQVKDLTESENEKVFIFNGWTFSNDPTIAPFDHAIYDLQLVNCNNV